MIGFDGDRSCTAQLPNDVAYARFYERRGCNSARRLSQSKQNHGRLKARLRPMRGLKRLHSTRVISAGHAIVHNLRRGHYEHGGLFISHEEIKSDDGL